MIISLLIVAENKNRLNDLLFFLDGLTKLDNSFEAHFCTSDHTIYDILIHRGFNVIKFGALSNKKTSSFVEVNQKKNTNVDPRKRKKVWVKEDLSIIKLFFTLLIKYTKSSIEIRKRLDTVKFDWLIAEGDRMPGINQLILKYCKKRRIKILIPYFTYGGKVPALALRSINNYNKIDNSKSILFWLTGLIWKENKEKYLGAFYLFYNPPLTLIYYLFRTKSKYPWYDGNGLSDIVCVNNYHSQTRYINNNVEKNKIRIVGDVSYDVIHNNYVNKEEKKAIITEKYNLDPSKKIIILSLPQLAEHNLLNWEEHWIEIRYLVETIERLNWNILISLHPKMEFEKYKFLEEEYNCKILRERLNQILPIGDAFVATFSSTIVWSVLCGIHSVVVDFYGLNYEMYNFLDSIKLIKNKDSFLQTLKNYLSQSLCFENDWSNLSKETVFDGKTMGRYKNIVMDEL